MSNRTQNRTDWADASGQVDYFVSAGFNNDSIYSTALTPGGTFVSISPIRSSGRPANVKPAGQRTYPTQGLNPRYGDNSKPAGRHTYPTQELNPRYGDNTKPAGQCTYPPQELNPRYGNLQLSPPKSDGNLKPPPLPPPQLPPSAPQGLASKFHVEEVTSMATGSSHDYNNEFHVEEVKSMATGLSQELNDLTTNSGGQSSNGTPNINVLDSFEIDSVGTYSIATGQPKSEGLDEYSSDDNLTAPRRVSTSPSPKAKHSEKRAAKSRKKTKGKTMNAHPNPKGKTKKATVGITHPTGLDILRGRGGLTNRHAGNMKFRDEARKLRADYRDQETSRQEKFLLSQVSAASHEELHLFHTPFHPHKHAITVFIIKGAVKEGQRVRWKILGNGKRRE